MDAREGLDSSVLVNKPAAVANWRWDTLRLLLEYFLPAFMILREVWHSQLFRNCRNRKLEAIARLAIHTEEFFDRFLVVHDLMIAIGKLRKWASGCLCHEADRLQGIPVRCSNQGKRLPEASARLRTFSAFCLRCIEEPQPDQETFQCDLGHDLNQHRINGWRLMLAMTEANLKFIRNQPYSLATVDDWVELEIERHIYLNTPTTNRHRYSIGLFSDAAGVAIGIIN